MDSNYFHFFSLWLWMKVVWEFFLWVCVCVWQKKLKITWLHQRQITTDETFTGKPGRWKKIHILMNATSQTSVCTHGGESTIPHFALNSISIFMCVTCFRKHWIEWNVVSLNLCHCKQKQTRIGKKREKMEYQMN